jgi:hypothetical protein
MIRQMSRQIAFDWKYNQLMFNGLRFVSHLIFSALTFSFWLKSQFESQTVQRLCTNQQPCKSIWVAQDVTWPYFNQPCKMLSKLSEPISNPGLHFKSWNCLNNLNLGSMLLHTTSDNQLFFLSYVPIWFSNSSSLFMSLSNLIWINVNIIDMKIHMLICLFISMLVGREKEWGSY